MKPVLLLLSVCLLAGACSSSDGDGAVSADETGPGSTTTSEATGDETGPPGTAGPPAAGGEDLVFPAAAWATADPDAMGVDAEALDTLATEAETADSTCLVVTRNGRLVGEWYWGKEPTETQQIFSATKSFTSGLLGIASAAGHLAIDDPASEYITEWQGTDSESVLVEHLLQNSSGRFYSYESDYVDMAQKAPDQSAYAIGLDQAHEPGTEWDYNNAAIQTLETVLERALDEPDIAGWGTTNLLEPIGMHDSAWLTDSVGNALTYMGIESTCRDMARYGLLWLAEGRWEGEQIISSDYVEAATTPVAIYPDYGYLWWLNNPDELRWPTTPNTFVAMGLGGQFISVHPETGLVVARQAVSNDGTTGPLVNLAGLLVD